MPRNLILHIGRHKSGTTSLQRFLAGAADELRSLGVIYPQEYRNDRKKIAHHGLSKAYNNKVPGKKHITERKSDAQELIAFWQDLNAQPGDAAVLSSETFQSLSGLALERLGEHLADFDVNVVVYLREQLDYLLSAYVQRTRVGRNVKTLEEFAEDFGLDYVDYLQTWRDALPQATFSVRIYDRKTLTGGSVVTDFIAAAGLTINETLQTAMDRYATVANNPSIGGPLVEIIRRLNASGRYKQAASARLFPAFASLAADNPAYRQRPAMPLSAQLAYRERFADSNRQLFESPGLAGRSFRSDTYPDLSYTTQIDPALVRDIAKQLNDRFFRLGKLLRQTPDTVWTGDPRQH